MTAAAGTIPPLHGFFIDGEFVDASGEDIIDVEDPATEASFARVARAGAADVDRAVVAARVAFDAGWRDRAPTDRSRMLLRLAEALESACDELARLETMDNGKP